MEQAGSLRYEKARRHGRAFEVNQNGNVIAAVRLQPRRVGNEAGNA